MAIDRSCVLYLRPCLWLIACCCGGHWTVCCYPSQLSRKLYRKLCHGDSSGKRKCEVTSTKPNWQANWTYNAITSLLLNGTFIVRMADMEKTSNKNWLPFSLSLTTSADTFLFKGNDSAPDQLMWEVFSILVDVRNFLHYWLMLERTSFVVRSFGLMLIRSFGLIVGN